MFDKKYKKFVEIFYTLLPYAHCSLIQGFFEKFEIMRLGRAWQAFYNSRQSGVAFLLYNDYFQLYYFQIVSITMLKP